MEPTHSCLSHNTHSVLSSEYLGNNPHLIANTDIQLWVMFHGERAHSCFQMLRQTERERRVEDVGREEQKKGKSNIADKREDRNTAAHRAFCLPASPIPFLNHPPLTRDDNLYCNLQLRRQNLTYKALHITFGERLNQRGWILGEIMQIQHVAVPS